MNKPHKVVWTKGMFLMPQHFQAQEEYLEQALHFRATASIFANWGFSRLGVDEASLANGLFTLRYCEGIFPDGLAFQANLIDNLPLRTTSGRVLFRGQKRSSGRIYCFATDAALRKKLRLGFSRQFQRLAGALLGGKS